MDTDDPARLRATVFLVSLTTIVVEIALMRELALRFWEHLAWLVISIALLGFGISGTILLLLQRFRRFTTSTTRYLSLLGLALSIPFCLAVAGLIDLDLAQMVWQPAQALRIGQLELILTLPFIFSGMYIGLALQDDSDRVAGHYGASFIGSAMGGLMALPLLFLFSPRRIMLGCAILIFGAALFDGRGSRRAAGGVCAAIILTVLIWQLPPAMPISADKDLPQLMAAPDSEIVLSRSSPQGLVHIVRAPAYHGAPGLSLSNTASVPEQLLVLIDGALDGTLHRIEGDDDFAFLDNTTMALSYALLDTPSRVLIGPEAGTEQIGLALYHGAERITALSDNSTLTRLKTAELAGQIGDLYRRPEVSLVTMTLRGYVHTAPPSYSMIHLPVTGHDFGGFRSAAPNPLLTLEALRACFNRLEPDGVMSITTEAHIPPRESLRLLNMFAALLAQSGKDPRTHLAVIRSWATVTLVAARSEISAPQAARIRTFCRSRGFDLVWLPDIKPAEVNRFHVLDEPQYFLGATHLLGAQHNKFAAEYVYDLRSPDDGKPFFHHFSRRLSTSDFSSQLGKRGRSYAEIGSLLLVAAFLQATVLALVLIVLPVVPTVGLFGSRSEQLLVVSFFSAIGGGFMLLEIGFLQKLEVYVGHPVYAATAVLCGFLFFGGLGSIISAAFRTHLNRTHFSIGSAIAALAIVYLLQLDTVLSMTEAMILPLRLAIVTLVTGPLALLMGMMFPLGVRRLGYGQAELIPWAWSVNGFTSVLATLLAPLLAMRWGFGMVGWSAALCYGLAALLSLGLPRR